MGERNYNLDNHCRSDKKKWWVTGIALVLGGVFLAAACTQGFKTANPWGWFDKEEQKQEQEDDAFGGGMELEDPEELPEVDENEPHVALATKIIPIELYDDYGISPLAETAIQVTATVLPAGAEDAVIDWSVAWESGASGKWGNGKTVTNYVTVTPTSDGALTANVSCSQAFGEVIVLTAAIRGNDSIKATKNVQYVQGYSSVSANIQYTHATAGNITWAFGSSANVGGLAYPGYASTYQDFVNYYSASGSQKGAYTVSVTTTGTSVYTKAMTVGAVTLKAKNTSSTVVNFYTASGMYSGGITANVEYTVGTGTGANATLSDFDFVKFFFPSSSGNPYAGFNLTTFKQKAKNSLATSSGFVICADVTVNGTSARRMEWRIVSFDGNTIATLASGVTMAGGDLEFGG